MLFWVKMILYFVLFVENVKDVVKFDVLSEVEVFMGDFYCVMGYFNLFNVEYDVVIVIIVVVLDRVRVEGRLLK